MQFKIVYVHLCIQIQNMEKIKSKIVNLASECLGIDTPPNFTEREFLASLIIFQTALTDKVWARMKLEHLSDEESCKMIESCMLELRKTIITYTGLDPAGMAKNLINERG